MDKEEVKNDEGSKDKRPRIQVRLPGFVTDEVVGLGDAIKQVEVYPIVKTISATK